MASLRIITKYCSHVSLLGNVSRCPSHHIPLNSVKAVTLSGSWSVRPPISTLTRWYGVRFQQFRSYSDGGKAYKRAWYRSDQTSHRKSFLDKNKEVVMAPAVSSKNFHTSQRVQFHPVFWMLVKPVAKIATVISGRSFRKWWKNLSDVDKQKVKAKLRKYRVQIAAAVVLLVAACVINYFTHIQEVPITHRRRYLAFTEEQSLKIAKFDLDVQWSLLRESIVDPRNIKAKKVYDLISNVAQNIINSNQDLEMMRKQKWTVVIVDNDEPNAFVLQTGHIFVFTGILKMTDNEDQLAVILGHEIAHVLLGHMAEKISLAGLLDVFVIVFMAGIWAFMPNDGIAIVTQWFYNKVIQLLLNLPYSRKLEAEADEIGLRLIAKSCYDVRESSTFWQRMALREELEDSVVPEWLSTHPASDNRATILDNLIPNALKMREFSHCPRLPAKDPRAMIETLRQIIDSERQKETTPSPANEAVVTTVTTPISTPIPSAAPALKASASST